MKIYFYLQCVLWLSMIVNSYFALRYPVRPMDDVKALFDVVLLSAALYGSFCLAWGRKKGAPQLWRMLSYLVLALGGLSVIQAARPMVAAETSSAVPGVLTLALIFLPYALFATPPGIYARNWNADSKRSGSGDPDPERRD